MYRTTYSDQSYKLLRNHEDWGSYLEAGGKAVVENLAWKNPLTLNVKEAIAEIVCQSFSQPYFSFMSSFFAKRIQPKVDRKMRCKYISSWEFQQLIAGGSILRPPSSYHWGL